MKPSTLKLLISALLVLAIAPVCALRSAESRPSGIVVFTSQGASYPKIRDYVSLKKTSSFFSNIVRSNGEQEEIPNSGIVAILRYPAGHSDTATTQAALDQISRVLAKYPSSQVPELHLKLNALATAWRTSMQAASPGPKSPAAPIAAQSAATKMTLTTIDGKRYDDVTITKIGEETLSFEHSAGVTTVPLSSLTPELQRRFNYDPTRIAQEAAARKEAALERQKADAAAALAAAKLAKVTDTPKAEPKASADEPLGEHPAQENPSKATPKKRVASAASGESDRNAFKAMEAKYDADKDAVSLPKLEKDKFYFIGGGFGQVFYIAQCGEDFILAANVRKQPWALLTFEDPHGIEGVQMQKGSTGRAIGRFVQFKEVPMADGSSQRYPVFRCTGIEINGAFVSTEKK